MSSGPPTSSAWRRLTRALRFPLRRFGVLQGLVLGGAFVQLAWLRATTTRGAERERRTSEILARAFGRLRGVFAKLGQFAALRVDLVAPAAREAFAVLHARVPPIRFEEITAAIEGELGAPLAHLYREIDPQPLGAASIAQVHAARLPDGRAVAVKVQYPWLAASLRADLAWLRFVARIALGTRGTAPAWLAEFASTLAEELDFVREAEVAREIAAHLAGDAAVVVPAVVASHSRTRVLTLERFSALPLGALAEHGIPRRPVLETIVRAYARQIFEFGLFHADPHPGNLYVVDEPEARVSPRVLFLDFGLSKRLAPELVRELRRGMLALLQRDLAGFVAGMVRIGAVARGAEAGVQDAVGAMFARLAGESGSPLALSGARVLSLKDEAKRLLFETPGLTLPNDLLLYAKTLSYVFALASEIAPEVDPMPLTVPYLLRFLAVREGAPAR